MHPLRSPRIVGFILGLIFFGVVLSLPTCSAFSAAATDVCQSFKLDPGLEPGSDPGLHPGLHPGSLASSMQSVFALLGLMVIWWITEAIPLPATALLPAVVLPFLHVVGVSGTRLHEFTIKNTLVNYANPVIYLFLGGFLLAAGMQKWGLDRRLTLWILTRGSLAEDSRRILFGMMAVTAFLSMWISNTACTAMMLPLGLGILSLMKLEPGSSRFGIALMLGIAWAASIGGVGTIIGTPPNGIALGILNATFADDPSVTRLSFLDWMAFGIPFVVIMIPLAWGVLVLRNPPEVRSLPGGKEQLLQEQRRLGPMQVGEKLAVFVFLFAVVLWASNPFWGLILPEAVAATLSWVDEYTIGLLVGLLGFIIPVNIREGRFLLDWRDTKFVDWGTLVLFGGGIALSDAILRTGLASWIATSSVGAMGTPSTLMLMIVIVLLVDFLTEITSNTAVTGMFVPIVISIALRVGDNPTTLTVVTAVAASMAFMLPVATPPNALVFGTGYVRIKDMVRNGFILDILGWIATVGILYLVGGLLFGVLQF